MLLETYQHPDFCLTSGDVDHSKSRYWALPGIQEAYAKLALRIGTDNYLWCSVPPPVRARVSPQPHCVKWVLEVPGEKILARIDEFVWARILKQRAIPDWLRRKVLEEGPDEADALDEYERQQFAEYLNQSPPSGGWWSVLTTPEMHAESVSYLVRHPVPIEWVLTGPILG